MISSNNFRIIILVAFVPIIHILLIRNLFSCNLISIQNSFEETDSLLLKGDICEVQIKYNNHELEYYNTDDLEELFSSVKIITTLDSNNIGIYVNQYKSLSNRYNIEYVGQNAHEAYEKYLYLSSLDDKKNALKFYYISVFFKKIFHKSVLKSARNIYIQANRNYIEGKYEEALKAIMSIKIFSGQNTELIDIEDSLKILHKNIIYKQIEKSRWNMTDLRTYKLFIGILPSVIYYGSVSDITLKIDNALFSFLDQINSSDIKEIHVSNIPSRYDYELYFSINYLFFGNLMIGLDIEYSALSIDSEYNNSASENNIFYDLKLRSYFVKSYLKYLFSDNVGFSPFCNFGIGYQYIKYNESIVGKYEWYTSPDLPYHKTRKIDYGDYALNSQNRLGIILEIGAEYIPSPSSFLIIGSKLGGYYFIERSDLLNNYNVTFSIYLGLII